MARPGIVSAHMVVKNAKVGIRSMNGVGEQEYSYKSIDVAELEQELGVSNLFSPHRTLISSHLAWN